MSPPAGCTGFGCGTPEGRRCHPAERTDNQQLLKCVSHLLRMIGRKVHFGSSPSGKVEPRQRQGICQNMESTLGHGGPLQAGLYPARLKTLVPMLT